MKKTEELIKVHHYVMKEESMNSELLLAKEILDSQMEQDDQMEMNLKHNQSLFLLIHHGYALIWIDGQCLSLDGKCSLFLHGKKDIQIQWNHAQFEFAILQGNNMKSLIEKEKIILDPCFYQKSIIFFRTCWSSLKKYSQVDAMGITSAIYRLFSDLSHYALGIQEDNVQHKMVQSIIEFIENHYTEDITLQMLENHLGYSKYYMLHVFTEVMGLSIHDYFIRRRLTQVKVLMMESDKSMNEIAKECGFKSEVSLYKSFKNIYSITPGQFKKQVKQHP